MANPKILGAIFSAKNKNQDKDGMKKGLFGKSMDFEQKTDSSTVYGKYSQGKSPLATGTEITKMKKFEVPDDELKPTTKTVTTTWYNKSNGVTTEKQKVKSDGKKSITYKKY